MRFKYKRIIILSSMIMMIVGMLLLSVRKPDKVVTSDKDIEERIAHAMDCELEVDKYPKVNGLIKNYLNAEVNCDIDTLKMYVNDIEKYSLADLQKKFSCVEYFENIKCYTIDGLRENSYVVFVYREYKMQGIESLIPSVVQLYVCENESGELVVYSGNVDYEVSEYIKNTENNKYVLELVDMVNNKLEQLKKKDNSVKDFLDKLSNAADDASSDENEEGNNGEGNNKESTDEDNKSN